MARPNPPSAESQSRFPLMEEIHGPLSDRAAVAESQRCLYCYDAPCIHACPTGIDVPTFVKKISTGDLPGAAKTILTANILGASCARVCPTEVLCEGACVLGHEYDPIQIGLLQRHATDFVTARGISVLDSPAQATGFRVAIIGAGPAGLGCAADLAALGHRVVIFEKEALAGGLNTRGVAYYKMKPKVSLDEVRLVESLGVEIRTGVNVGKDLHADELLSEYDAIFVAIGLGGGSRLGVPGEVGAGVRAALDFIRDIHEMPLESVSVGKTVLVIGGGNTAIDAVSQAKRIGASSATLAYRRKEEQMSAYAFEVAQARAADCRLIFEANPREVVRNDEGNLTGVRFTHASSGMEWIEPCDQLLLAIGQPKQDQLLKSLFPALELNARGCVATDPLTARTSIHKVFAGGDCANGGMEVVNAVGEGKKAAMAIHHMLTGKTASPKSQASRSGIARPAAGAGLWNPIRSATH